MKKKWVEITLQNGDRWQIDVENIVVHRANSYYQDAISEGDEDAEIGEFIEGTKSLFNTDDFEIEDWMKNNMDWEDLGAVKVESGPEQPEDWMNSKMEVITEV